MAYRKIEQYDENTTREIAGHIEAILKLLGEDPTREGLQKTPERVAKAMQFLTQGYFQDGETLVKSALFQEPYNHMVIVKDIELFSLCEHHMLPFIGKAHVAYIPKGEITGLSKVARVVETFARRLQVQERLTEQIRDCIQESLHPLGVAVVILHVHARGAEIQRHHHHIGLLGHFPQKRQNPQRVPAADRPIKKAGAVPRPSLYFR